MRGLCRTASKPSGRPVYGRGLIRWHSGDRDRAALDFEQAIRLDPNLAVAYTGRASVHIERGQYDQATQDYGQARLPIGRIGPAGLRPGHPPTAQPHQGLHLPRTDPLCARRVRPRGPGLRAGAVPRSGCRSLLLARLVLPAAGRVLGCDAGFLPSHPHCAQCGRRLQGRGHIYAVRHQYDLAIQEYDRALRINPEASDYQSRGWAYCQKGEYISALGNYVQATRRQPSILLRWPWTWLVALALLAYLFLRRQSAKLADMMQCSAGTQRKLD